MLNGYKPWQKIIFENFLMILSLMVIVLIRIIGKFMKPDFGVYNLLALVLATIGFLLLSFSKREQLKRKEFFKFGVGFQNHRDHNYYRAGYFLLVMGLILTFVI